VSIREKRYKLAKYYSFDNPDDPCEWEMYDLLHNPDETENLAHHSYQRDGAQEAEFLRLKVELANVQKTRLQPRSWAPIGAYLENQ
jgi:hypothetical protein